MSERSESPRPAQIECRAEPIDFHGWRAIRLTNEFVAIVLVPDIGGRVMSLTLGAHEYLFRNPAHLGRLYTYEENLGDGTLLAWKNYGGDKTWPAPQGWSGPGEWAGPPDPVLDSGRFDATTWRDGSRVGVTMVSPPDPRSGLRLTRSVSLAPGLAEVRLDLAFENVSDRTVRWSIWDVTQMDCSRPAPGGASEANPDAWLYIPTSGTTADERPYRVLFGAENPQWRPDVAPGILGVQYLGYVAKIGVDSRAGWVAFADRASGHICCPRFTYEPETEYPDGGAPVECWTESPGARSELDFQSAGCLMEVEVLGPLRTLAPSDRTTQTIHWSLARGSGPIVDVGEAGCVLSPLRVTSAGPAVRTTGEFGVFVAGDATLAWLSAAGGVLESTPLGPVSPLAPVNVDIASSAPAGASRVALRVRSADRSAERTIATAIVG
jgi:hypothetical protein